MGQGQDQPVGSTQEPVATTVEVVRPKRRPRRRLLKTAVIVVGVAILFSLSYGLLAGTGAESEAEAIPTAAVKRGDLVVTVTQRGSIWAMDPLEIKSEVENWNMILEIVDEGTVITQKGVDQGLVLVRLDSSRLEQSQASKQITVYRAEAWWIQAKENYDIRKKQNESDIAIAKLKVKFDHMELERYLGADLAAHVIDLKLDFADLGDNPILGGMAQQELRIRQSAVQLAEEELSRAEETLRWTEELAAKGYVNRNEVTADQVAVTFRTIQLDAAKERLRLFRRYALPQQAEQRYSDHVESQRDLARVVAKANSQLAQAEATLRSREASYNLEKQRLDKLTGMIEKCVILAPKPGLVIYGSSGSEMYRQDTIIEEGASVQENAVLIRIPDLSDLAVKMNVPEANIDKLKVGQPALITMEAVPDRTFLGRVARISAMANPAHAYLNPEAKVYETDVALEEVPERFIPGMSATAEIVVAHLKDVLYVPAQAVTTRKGYSFCWIKGEEQPREVQTGHFADKYTEITDGLREDEEVYLAPPGELEEEIFEKLEEAEEARQRESAGQPERPEQQAPVPGRPEQPPAEQRAEEPAEEAQSEYVVGGRINWQKLGPELRGLSEEDRQKKLEEILSKLSPEQRTQVEEQMRRMQSMSPEQREGRRQQRGGGAQQRGGSGGSADRQGQRDPGSQ